MELASRIGLGLGGLAFASFALFFAYAHFGGELGNAWRVRSWVQTPATVMEVPAVPRGIQAKYRYTYNGQPHTGTRVGFYDTWSGYLKDDFHRETSAMLRARLQAGGDIQVWVNPLNPAEAVIERRILWDDLWMPMAMCSVFLTIGLLVAGFGFFYKPKAAPTAAEAQARIRSSRVIAGSRRHFPWSICVFAALWNGLVAIPLLDGVSLVDFLGHHPFLGVVFLAVGVVLLYGAVIATLRHRRYRRLALNLAPHPPAAGGELAGTLTVPIPFRAENRFKLVLEGVEHSCKLVLEADERGRLHRVLRSEKRTLFQEEAVAYAEATTDGTRLRFSFRLPPEAPPSAGYGETLTWTSATVDRVYLKWRLSVMSDDVPGVDLDESFEVPVVAPAQEERPAPALTPTQGGLAGAALSSRAGQATPSSPAPGIQALPPHQPAGPGKVGLFGWIFLLVLAAIFHWAVFVGDLSRWSGSSTLGLNAGQFTRIVVVTIDLFLLLGWIAQRTTYDGDKPRPIWKKLEELPSWKQQAIIGPILALPLALAVLLHATGVLDRVGAALGQPQPGLRKAERVLPTRALDDFAGWWGFGPWWGDTRDSQLNAGWISRLIVRQAGHDAYLRLWQYCPPNHCEVGEFQAKVRGDAPERVQALEITWLDDRGMTRTVLLRSDSIPDHLIFDERRGFGPDRVTDQKSAPMQRVKYKDEGEGGRMKDDGKARGDAGNL